MKKFFLFLFVIISIILLNIPTAIASGGTDYDGKFVYDPITGLSGCDCTILAKECTCRIANTD